MGKPLNHVKRKTSIPSLVYTRSAELGYTSSFVIGSRTRKVQFAIYDSTKTGVIERYVQLDVNGSWKVAIFGKEVRITGVPCKLNITTQVCLLETVAQRYICAGNSDDKFSNLKLDNTNGYIDSSSGSPTIRHNKCEILVDKERCNNCQVLRASLRATLSRQSKQSSQPRTSTSSNTPLSCLTKTELTQRYKNLKEKERFSSNQNKLLLKKLEHFVESQQISTSPLLDTICKDTLSADQQNIEPGTYMDLFIKQQIKAQQTQKNGMRWHPLLIRWALGLKSKSASAYRYLNKSNFLRLPSESTLSDYIHYRSADAGVDIDGLIELKSRFPDGTDVALIADEIKIKDGLLYKNGTITGFITLDDLDSAIRSCISCTETVDSIATHGLAYLVQGLKEHLYYPVAIYSTRGVTSSQMYSTFWECVEYLELSNLRVRTFISDGAAANRGLFKYHAPDFSDDKITYRCMNKFAERPIYFISDAPHLLKTTRNCLENSGSHLNTRYLMLHDKPVLWEHIRSIYEDTLTHNGFITLHKLRHDHINLNSYSRMSVKLAAQVLSESVANAMKLKNKEELSSTVEFIQYINKAFDCLNVNSLYAGGNSKNDNLNAYTSLDDPRLQWLKIDFLGWLSDWEQSVRSKCENDKDSERFLLSKATREGWRITISSFTSVAKDLINEGYEYVLSRKLVCQDIIEQFFARHRQSCGGSSAPTISDLINNTHSFRVTRHVAIERGTNCSHVEGNSIIELKRRKR